MAQKKQKQTRRRMSPEVKVAAVERAKTVGVTEAGREFDVGASVLGRWVKKAGVTVPRFHFAPGRGLVRVDVDDAELPIGLDPAHAPSLGQVSGNPIPRQVEVTPPDSPNVADTARNRKIARAALRTGASQAEVGMSYGISGSRVSQIVRGIGHLVERETSESKARGVADNESNRALALQVLRGKHPVDVAKTEAVSSGHIYQIMRALGRSVAEEHGLAYDPKKRFGRSKASAESKPTETATLTSRPPEPTSGPRRANASRQLGLYEPGEREPQRVNGVVSNGAHHFDEAEHARDTAERELMETSLRTALKEREAFKIVLDVLMREKNQ